MIEFSIIIPIYKVEKYLKACVESVLSQSYQNYEVILVDDGSPDSCGDICDEYAAMDSKVKVIHKKNGGLSSARNAGLDIACGNYIIFLDSDDYWDDIGALRAFHEHLAETSADILLFPFKKLYENKNRIIYDLKENVNRTCVTDINVDNAIEYLIKNNIYRAAAWNKVVKRSLIEENHLRFKEGYLSEDMDWCGDLLFSCSRFDFYDNPLYVYRQQRGDSITGNKNEKLVSDKLYMCNKGYQQVQAMNDPVKANLLGSYYAYEYAVLLGVSSGIRNKQLLMEIKELQALLNYSICNKVKKVIIIKKILGYAVTRRLLCFFVCIKK